MAPPTSSPKIARRRRALAASAATLMIGVMIVSLSVRPEARFVVSAQAATPGPALPELITPDTQASINKALEFLARTQRHDGSWLAESHYRSYSATMTSLAGLALMANGSTAEEGPYARHLSRAIDYVLRQARDKDGLIAGSGSAESMYDHGFSMLFLAQCYGTEINATYEQRIHDVLTKAVILTAKSQSNLGKRHRYAGGWYYRPGDSAQRNQDEGSVTVTQLQALRACRNAGIKVPKSTIARAVEYLRYCQGADGGIRYSARTRGGGGRPAISAAALACFYAAGVYDRQAGGAGPEAQMVERLWNYLREYGDPSPDRAGWYGHWDYMHFYYAQAMYQRGGEQWNTYYRTIEKRLRSTQKVDGSWSGGVGSVYRTSIAAIILQLPYGYLPICQR